MLEGADAAGGRGSARGGTMPGSARLLVKNFRSPHAGAREDTLA
ncbi:MAG TPA: hypothetical protein VHG91_06300 [Longimicrobium sp.]|nr:hypothetical protein [Longimicrobium sp.]